MTSPKGYVSGLPGDRFTANGTTTIVGPMPGNLPGQVTYSTGTGGRAASPYTTQATPTGWMPWMPFQILASPAAAITTMPSAIRNCLSDTTTRGSMARCTSTTATVTFQKPVVNPVINVFGGRVITTGPGGGQAADRSGCLMEFTTAGIGRVNGQAAKSGQVSLANNAGMSPGQWSLSLSGNNEVVPSGSFPTPANGTCATDPLQSNTNLGLQVQGLVSSVEVVIPIYQIVVKPLASNYFTNSASNWVAYPESWIGFSVPGSDLSIVKTAPATVDPGGEVEWQLTVSNAAASADSHGFIIKDAIPANVANAALVGAPTGCTLSGRDLVCAVAPPGYTISRASGLADTNTEAATLDAPGTTDRSSVGVVLAAGGSMTVKFTGTSPSPGPSTITNTAYVYGADLDPNTGNNTSTAKTEVAAQSARWTLSKSATVGGSQPAGGVVKPGDVITYTVTATSTEGAIHGAVIADNLSGVLHSATFVANSAKLVVGDASQDVPDPSGTPVTLTSPSFDISDGQSATLSYRVTVNQDAWLSTLTNSVTGTADVPLTSCEPCSTTHKTGALVLIQKTGIGDDGATISIAGAAFEVLADANGSPGAVIPGAPVTTVAGQTGAYRIEGIMPGTYWLHETTAPARYELMAHPVAFTVGATGAIALVDAHANPNVTVADKTITVADSPSFALPFTGAAAVAYPWFGAGLAATALVWAALARRRKARADTN